VFPVRYELNLYMLCRRKLNLLGDNIDNMKKNTETLIDASKVLK
jgi:hypothetical protein